MFEIERKFLIKKKKLFDVLKQAKSILLIAQWYLTDEEEVRIRLMVDKLGKTRWISTLKQGIGLIRRENESELQPSEAENMFIRLKASPAIIKIRRVYPDKDFEGVIDDYYFPELGYVAEIELLNQKAQMPYPWNFWNLPEDSFFEVTELKGYTAWELSRVFDGENFPIIEKKLEKELVPQAQKSAFMKILKEIYER
ncbi:hypothetical protein [Kosmotoga pacifica]|uniref:CYTH domain-containing protein n=1 Tax=Kosmotoga pacifica TaxID=1330330 RepID=A0A0G2Z563_9BACT|nr:hypothetical protein [Kosmotoga pacifica]AKI96755.1 hypothetical protein IX53_01760 [Kosmotoga pacifica]